MVAEEVVKGRRSLVLENAVTRLVVDILGGSFVDFHLLDQQLNPLVWNNDGDCSLPSQMSHFLCLDRWGYPSAGEAARGMPYHGEASLVEWRVTRDEAAPAAGRTAATMEAHLPLAGLHLRRSIRLEADEACFSVIEEVTNLNNLGCVLNMVQHPSIGPPFLDESTVVDANAADGFLVGAAKPNPEQRSFQWPQALTRDGHAVDMRGLRDNEDPNVVAYVIEGRLGWATAANPALGLLIGYVWNTADYPWFNAWRRVKDGKPFARGLEFGTTGLDWPHAELLCKGQIFGRPLFVHLDAGATLTKSFSCFLLRVPGDYTGVGEVRLETGRLSLIERKYPGARTLTMGMTQSK